MKKGINLKRHYYLMQHWTLNQYLHYLGLRMRKFWGHKNFRVSHATICTTEGIITIGNEYQYKEGSQLNRIIIENVDFKNRFIYVNVHFLEKNKKFRVSHLMNHVSYGGMWRIYNKGHYDIKEWYADQEPIDQAMLDSLPVITIP